jgi:hypothetical protein
VITLATTIIEKVQEKLVFFAPILIVIVIAGFLVFCTFLAEVMISATIVTEEGSGSEAASAGFVNALTFIIPAVIGGFLIALLFKYRKKLTLKFFFGGALFFAGTFITFFFADSILYLIRTQFYSLFILEFSQNNIEIFSSQPLVNLEIFYPIIIICCGLIGFWMTYIMTSNKFRKKTKNYAILIQSALMGAFLSVILPTYTVIILLIALSIYDIYSVRRGPIKDIVKYTLEEEVKYNNNPQTQFPESSQSRFLRNTMKNDTNKSHNLKNSFMCALCSISTKFNGTPEKKENEEYLEMEKNKTTNPKRKNEEPIELVHRNSTNDSMSKSPKESEGHYPLNTYQPDYYKKEYNFIDNVKSKKDDDIDNMLTSMTYSAKEWDVGIGDLVFYSMLASQPLTPYFIFTHGLGLLSTYGLWIFWLISLFTIIGILIGFVITIKLLEKNSMLPGLPCSIALGLCGFLGSTIIISLI